MTSESPHARRRHARRRHARRRHGGALDGGALDDDTATLSTATDSTDAATDASVTRAGHRRCHRCVGDASGRISGGGGPSGSGRCRGRCSRGGGCDGRASCVDAIKTLFAESARARAAKAADDAAISLRLLQDLQGQMDVGVRVNPILARCYGVFRRHRRGRAMAPAVEQHPRWSCRPPQAARMALRERNLNSERPSETTLKSLDSSLKKVAAFLQKIKERLGEETRKQLLEELPKLNLSKYVEEVALGVSEAELKLKDLAVAAELCSVVKQRRKLPGGGSGALGAHGAAGLRTGQVPHNHRRGVRHLGALPRRCDGARG